MSYLIGVFLLVVLAPACGYRWGAALGSRRWRVSGTLFVALVLWLAGGILARRYAETDGWGWPVAEWFAHRGKWYGFAGLALFFSGVSARVDTRPLTRGRIILSSITVLIIVWTMVWRTIPVYTFLRADSWRDDTGVLRQSVPYTCAPMALANLLVSYHAVTNVSERELARLSATTYEGTTTTDLIRAARRYGLVVDQCRTLTFAELRASPEPAIVFISTTPGVRHATLFIRMDGDVACFMDPDRGLWAMTRERFLQAWYGKALIFKPARKV